MAITINALILGKTVKEGGKTPFVIDAYSADVTGNETLKAAAVSGDNYLTMIALECPAITAAATVQINNDTTIMIGPLISDASAGLAWSHYFDTPIKLYIGLNNSIVILLYLSLNSIKGTYNILVIIFD